MLEKDPKWAQLWIYFLYNECDKHCHEYNHVLPGGRWAVPHTPKTQKEYEELRYTKFWAIAQTKHFGVTFEPKEEGQTFPGSKDFDKWYDFWHNYIEGLPNKTWDKLNETFGKKGDLAPYWPTKAWNEEWLTRAIAAYLLNKQKGGNLTPSFHLNDLKYSNSTPKILTLPFLIRILDFEILLSPYYSRPPSHNQLQITYA